MEIEPGINITLLTPFTLDLLKVKSSTLGRRSIPLWCAERNIMRVNFLTCSVNNVKSASVTSVRRPVTVITPK